MSFSKTFFLLLGKVHGKLNTLISGSWPPFLLRQLVFTLHCVLEVSSWTWACCLMDHLPHKTLFCQDVISKPTAFFTSWLSFVMKLGAKRAEMLTTLFELFILIIFALNSCVCPAFTAVKGQRSTLCLDEERNKALQCWPVCSRLSWKTEKLGWGIDRENTVVDAKLETNIATWGLLRHHKQDIDVRCYLGCDRS